MALPLVSAFQKVAVRCTHIHGLQCGRLPAAFSERQRATRSASTSVEKPFAEFNEPFHPIPGREPKWQSAADAVTVIKSHDKVFVHGIAATPTPLLSALADHALGNSLEGISLHHIHLEGEAEWAKPEYDGVIRSNCFFISNNLRKAVNEGRADSLSIFLSEIPILFRRRIVNLDVALIQVSPPDSHGFCSLGTSVDCTRAALQNAKYVIGLANPKMPRTFGDGIVHKSHFDSMVYEEHHLPTHPRSQLSEEELTIGQIIANNLVDDGATLQMGIGSIPDAALGALKGHKDLGIHTEMFSDGALDLIKCGAVTNSKKVVAPGKVVSSFCVGTRHLYAFLHDNPMVFMGDVSFTNDVHYIRQNPKVTAINSCIELDLTGQVVADSIGTRMYSGFGGQIDFIRGAALCPDGVPIIAMTSTTKKGDSKIVPVTKEGAGVVTTRAHVRYVVTEYGYAQLFGKNLRQRAYELIKISHPDHREALEKSSFERLKCMPSSD